MHRFLQSSSVEDARDREHAALTVARNVPTPGEGGRGEEGFARGSCEIIYFEVD